ncbi:MAG: Tyrosine-specific transport protein [Chlamydiales bacterium]|nr:Tyrosine-specific transport protein [Chlamydiales bacterium]
MAQFKEGSLFGGVLLIAGSCIGAGMLALPVITGMGGFGPSVVMFLIIWLFMTSTGLLLLETNLALGHHLSLISIAERTLGKWGKLSCWVLFLFLFYSLSIAYISASGSILQSINADLFGFEFPVWGGSLFFTLVFACVLFIGTRHVDYVNRALMLGLVITYFVLVLLGSQYIHREYLAVKQWRYAFAALPVLVTSFGFHNMIPSLAMYMKGDTRRLRITILIGSLIPLLIYLVWEVVMLGIIPIEGRTGLLHALDQGEAATEALRAVVGRSWINTVAQAFALFAIITSFLAQSLSLVDFLADGLKLPKVGLGRATLVLMALVPPFTIAFVYPGIFISALNFAGGFAAVLLFGVMPVLMIWVTRYKRKLSTTRMLPLGRAFLVLVMLVAVGIFLLETAQELGFSLIPEQVEAIP